MVVQLGGGRRSLLRLYEVDAAPGAALHVRAYEFEEGRLVADRVVPLVVSENRFLPGYAQIPINDAFFFPGTDLRFAFRIRIDPVVSGQRFWGMVSVTNNATNEFTLITPEP
jgi:hypothetical protein